MWWYVATEPPARFLVSLYPITLFNDDAHSFQPFPRSHCGVYLKRGSLSDCDFLVKLEVTTRGMLIGCPIAILYFLARKITAECAEERESSYCLYYTFLRHSSLKSPQQAM